MLGISAWASELTGIPGDWWTAFQFDSAVSWFGRHIENKLMERDKNGDPKYKLESLLADRKNAGNTENLRLLKNLIGSG